MQDTPFYTPPPRLSKQEQLAIVVRYIDPDSILIVERFLTYIVATNLTAESLSKYILDTLQLYNLDVKMIVLQGYDGASVMSGVCNGVQKRIRDVAPQALYVHCHAHCSTCRLCEKQLPCI